jgi:hypothetical protein
VTEVYATAERTVESPPREVYAVIADFEHHHPHILPPAFSGVRVEKGGIGTGTVISYRMKVGGREYPCLARIDEPEPGRVLTESLEDGTVTTFTVAPQAQGSLVRIETRYQRGGVRGWIERLLVPRILVPIFKQELDMLAEYTRANFPELARSDAR